MNVCDSCHFVKQHKLIFHSSNSLPMIPLISRMFGVTSIRDFRYFFTIVDDHSRHT